MVYYAFSFRSVLSSCTKIWIREQEITNMSKKLNKPKMKKKRKKNLKNDFIKVNDMFH